MFEKVNPCHPDKVADRIAGAIVDLCYTKSRNPKVACEVLIGHGECTLQIETSERLTAEELDAIVHRIAGEDIVVRALIVPQDVHLADNQKGGVRCGDNGIFKGCAPTHEQKLLTAIAASIYDRHPSDGKYLITDMYERWPSINGGPDKLSRVPGGHELTICQSNAKTEDIQELIWTFFRKNKASTIPTIIDRAQIGTDMYFWTKDKINPLGEWMGGPNTDSGATNRKLGSDMGDGVTGGGLHGKDLSKGDVSVNIVCHLLAVRYGEPIEACCSIGDEEVTFNGYYSLYAHERNLPKFPITMAFAEIVEKARLYIHTLGGFEKFAEWGLIRPLAQEETFGAARAEPNHV